MGKLISTFCNRSVQRFTAMCMLLMVLLFAGEVMLHRYEDRQVFRENVEYRLSLAGKLRSLGLDDEKAADAVTAPIEEEYIIDGEEILAVYGYSRDEYPGKVSYFSAHILSDLLAAGGVFLCMAAGLVVFCAVFEKIRIVTSKLEHDEDIPLSDEHDIRLLCEAAAALRERTQHLLRTIKGEKEYLAEYLSDFSHQIKTPCTGLMLNTDILLSDPMPYEEQREYLTRCRNCIDRISMLITASLKLARLDAGAVEYNMEDMDASLPAADAVAQLAGIAKKYEVRLINETENGEILRCDRLWFCEALTNLIKNAIEHTRGGEVRVYTKSDPMTLRIFIEDNGCGISAEDLPFVFRRFWSRSSSSDPVSVGIGMAMSKRITEDMGGKLFIDSEEGKGTKITLEFLK